MTDITSIFNISPNTQRQGPLAAAHPGSLPSVPSYTARPGSAANITAAELQSISESTGGPFYLTPSGGMPLGTTAAQTSPPAAAAAAPVAGALRNPFTYRGPNADGHRGRRLHQDFKALSKGERQRLVEQQAADSDLLARTVHLRFLPTMMRQSELTKLCAECGTYLRVRICGNSTNNQNWIYGFVEFSTTAGAARMLRRSGTELPNGPGRPPLRLRCDAAKQPIVDRIFHDADPATNTPCVFGLGNFANRTLKDALDSYFNLKAKETHGEGFSVAGDDRGIVGMQPATHLSPHAKAYEPPAELLLPMPTTMADLRFVEQEESSSATGITPRCHRGQPERGAESTQSPARDRAAERVSPHLVHGGLEQLLDPLGSHGVTGVEVSAMHALPTPAFALPPACVASQLSVALQSLMTSPQATISGADILQRGRVLALTALHQGYQYVSVQREFGDAVAVLKSLLALLDQHSSLTGGAAHTGAGDANSELPQRVTQLRLLANLMLGLLHAFRRSLHEALPFLKAVVTCCAEIPMAPVKPPASLQPSGSTTGQSSVKGSEDALEQRSLSAGTIGEQEAAPGPDNGFDVFKYTSEDLLRSVMGYLPGDEVDEEAHATEQLYRRDVAFQSFVLNVLLAVGLVMEEVQPLITRYAYAVAAQRGQEVLHVTSAKLQMCLTESADGGGGAVRRLSEVLYPELPAHARDITSFPRLFFTSAEQHRSELEQEVNFWSALPPNHCISCFSKENE